MQLVAGHFLSFDFALTLDISNVLMMKSEVISVSSILTNTEPYNFSPSSGQYCSHFL